MDKNSLLSEIQKVFGFKVKKDAEDFLEAMAKDSDKPVSPFLDKMNKIKYFPREPKKPNTKSNSESDLEEYLYRTKKEQYNKNVKELKGRTTPLENEINVKNTNTRRGAYGFVKPNTSRPYVYKFMKSSLYYEDVLRSTLTEPLINVFLQTDTRSKPFVCKLYSVFIKKKVKLIPEESEVELIYKLENLDTTLVSYFDTLSENEKEKNKNIILRIYGPLYETLHYLEKTYDFHHNDLHANNIMISKISSSSGAGTGESSIPTAKMIDFGLSNFTYHNKTYGFITARKTHEVSIIVRLKHKDIIPKNFIEETITTNTQDDKIVEIENYIIAEYKKLSNKGGKRRQTRKKKRSTS